MSRSIDGVRDFFGVGIVFRSATGKMRQVRMPQRPGDLTLYVLFGPPPSETPTPPPPSAAENLRHESIVAGLTCGSALIGWIGLVAGAFVAGPVGWVAISLVAFDATASGAAAISCLESGVRVLNEKRGRHELNEKMDANSAYAASSRAQDAIGLASLPRAAVTTSKAIAGVVSETLKGAAAATLAATATKVVKEVVLSREVRVEVLNAVGAGIGLVGSTAGGVAKEIREALPPFPKFTVALAN